MKLHEMALWMLNKCPMPEDQSLEDREWTAFILTDTATNKSCIASGYRADIFFPSKNVSRIVAKLDNANRKGIQSRAYLETLGQILSGLDNSKYGVKVLYKKFKKKRRK